jgi:hypothetical protein
MKSVWSYQMWTNLSLKWATRSEVVKFWCGKLKIIGDSEKNLIGTVEYIYDTIEDYKLLTWLVPCFLLKSQGVNAMVRRGPRELFCVLDHTY